VSPMISALWLGRTNGKGCLEFESTQKHNGSNTAPPGSGRWRLRNGLPSLHAFPIRPKCLLHP
jgi:hypothetical protein